MSSPRSLDAGLASALPRMHLHCLMAASSSWTPLCPLSATGLPGAALSCSYLASPRSHLPGAPAPLGLRWTPHVVETAQPPPPQHRGPHSCAGPPDVASCCCHHLRVPVSPRARHTGTPAPPEPRRTLHAVEVDWPSLLAPGRRAAAPLKHPRSLQANASPGELARLPRPLSAQPRL